MNLWTAYDKDYSKADFGTKRYMLKTGTRQHTSLAMVADRGADLDINKAIVRRYSENGRYVLARSITSDLFVSIYDVDKSSAILMRPSIPLNPPSIRKIKRNLSRFSFKNTEIRVIGMQNGNRDLIGTVAVLRDLVSESLIEMDIFGNETRNIAIDLKTGGSYDLLLNNKIYGPAELLNVQTQDAFNATKSDLTFV